MSFNRCKDTHKFGNKYLPLAYKMQVDFRSHFLGKKVHLIVREIRSFLFNKLLRFFNRLCYGTIRFDGHPEHLPQLPNITLGSSRIVKSERDVAEVSSFIK